MNAMYGHSLLIQLLSAFVLPICVPICAPICVPICAPIFVVLFLTSWSVVKRSTASFLTEQLLLEAENIIGHLFLFDQSQLIGIYCGYWRTGEDCKR